MLQAIGEPEFHRVVHLLERLGDLERQLEHFVTGRYSATFRHALA